MNNEINNPSVRTYYIERNGSTGYNFVDPGYYFTSGQVELEIFTDYQLWKDRVIELGEVFDEDNYPEP
jgi:hypothetical protein